jgi:hypothetical protein
MSIIVAAAVEEGIGSSCCCCCCCCSTVLKACEYGVYRDGEEWYGLAIVLLPPPVVVVVALRTGDLDVVYVYEDIEGAAAA